MKRGFILAAFLIVASVGYYIFKNNYSQSKSPTSTSSGPVDVQSGIKSTDIAQNSKGPDIEIVAENLDIPWEVVLLPQGIGENSGKLLLTERPGKLLVIGKDKSTIAVSGVKPLGEGGLLGLVLHPNFINNHSIYLYLTGESDGETVNRVERYKLEGDTLTERKIIIDGIAGAANHDGGRLRFGPDGYLYATTGDAQNSSLSQDTTSLNGKILRVTADGDTPPDNPFGNAVYSYGHRNVQGLAWDDKGRLWATEHGRSGVLSGLDELNLIEPEKNYGWPVIQGDEGKDGMVSPIINSGTSETWAPSGAEYYDDSIFFAGLRGETLYEAKIDQSDNSANVTELIKHFTKEYGRLRTVKLASDGYFYVLTNNRDGRGQVHAGDDKIIKINPKIFR